MCETYARQYGRAYISAMPTNLYGVGDNFDLQTSHVLPALLRKIDEAVRTGCEEVVIWGSGTPKREFLYVDDLADALVFLLQHSTETGPVNVGTGEELTVAELASTLAAVIGFKGRFVFDSSKPDGTPCKVSDVSLLHSLGWRAKTNLLDGIRIVHDWYRMQSS